MIEFVGWVTARTELSSTERGKTIGGKDLGTNTGSVFLTYDS
jgi:hypothetical protein